MDTYTYGNLPTDLSYDKGLDWYLDRKNIANNELVVETISYFEIGPGKGTATPIDFLNFLYRQYRYLADNLHAGESILEYFTNLPISEIQLHGLLGHIIKWFGGYPVNFMDRSEQVTMKAIERFFLGYPGNTAEKEYSKGNSKLRNKLQKYGIAYTAAARNNLDVQTLLTAIDDDDVPRNCYQTFDELFTDALQNTAIGPFEDEEKCMIEQAKLNYEYNVWLTEFKNWEYSDRENYFQKLTKENFLEFLRYKKEKKKELLQQKQKEVDSWKVAGEIDNPIDENRIDLSMSLITEFSEKITPMMNELASKYAPNGELPIIKDGSHLMELLQNFYGPYHLMEIQQRIVCLEGGFTKENIEGHLKDINEFIASSENISHNKAMNHFINLPFSKEADKPEYIYYKLKKNLYASSPLWKNALISSGVQYDRLTFEHHWNFIELYTTHFFLKDYLLSLQTKAEESKSAEPSSFQQSERDLILRNYITDKLKELGDIFGNKGDFSIAVEAIAKFIECKEQPKSRIWVKSKNRKKLAYQLGEIWTRHGNGVIPREYLIFYKNAFSIYADDNVEEGAVFGNKLYKYSISKT